MLITLSRNLSYASKSCWPLARSKEFEIQTTQNWGITQLPRDQIGSNLKAPVFQSLQTFNKSGTGSRLNPVRPFWTGQLSVWLADMTLRLEGSYSKEDLVLQRWLCLWLISWASLWALMTRSRHIPVACDSCDICLTIFTRQVQGILGVSGRYIKQRLGLISTNIHLEQQWHPSTLLLES